MLWAKHGIQPHLLEGYLTSNDPDFEARVVDVIGPYMNPPQEGVVFSVDEKTAIQAFAEPNQAREGAHSALVAQRLSDLFR